MRVTARNGRASGGRAGGPADRAAHHNSVLRRSTARARELEPKLARILEPILAWIGEEAAQKFEQRATDFLTASTTPGVTSLSTMIALKPRPAEAAQLDHQQIATDELHCTLCYLGETDMPLERLQAVLAAVAASHAPLEGSVAGIAAFAAGENGHPSIVLPSVPGLVELRVAVTQALAAAGVDFSREYGFVPHVTVAYSDQTEEAIAFPSIDSFGQPLHFDAIHIVRGNREQIELPLTGGTPITASLSNFLMTNSTEVAGDPIADLRGYAAGDPPPDGIDSYRPMVAHVVEEQLGEIRHVRAAASEPTVEAQITEVAERHQPDGGYGQTYWNADEQKVIWVSADWSSNEEIDAAVSDFLEIEGVDVVESCDECGAPDDSFVRVWSARYHHGPYGLELLRENMDTQTLTADAKWSAPVGDELVDVDALVKTLRTKTDPVRMAVIETSMTAALEGVDIQWDATNPFTAKVLAQSGSQIVNIAKSTQLNVMRIIRASYDEGLTIPDTAKAIRRGMKEASIVRATLIARTELAGAVNGGAVAATSIVSEATGIGFEKTWKTADGAVYPRHEDYPELDGQTVGLDEYFDVGGYQLQFPGDPDGPVEEVANCRCAVVFIEAGVEVGEESAE